MISLSKGEINCRRSKGLGSKRVKELLLKLFNSCLEFEVYPWNTSITTPLHKKGDRQNPDNYRAITVGSCIGKLFSSLLLNRLTNFRASICPDPPNQLGFRPGAQCADHILTLSTIVEKYTKKLRSRVFTCFVDYRKAFDTVCRDALMFKLSKMGIQGSFFNCIRHMYANSSTRIKLIQKLSEAIDVTIGTEQGHPLSPELFKIFIHDLSDLLDELKDTLVPNLNGFFISHLLWADDLILLALDGPSLQRLLDSLHEFASHWDLSINIDKTHIMVFNRSSRILNCAYGFKLGDLDIAPTNRYCYLGINFSLNGSFKFAMNELRKKGLKSYFAMKRMIDTSALSTKTLLKLIDSLVKPVATYACQIWLPFTNILQALSSYPPQERPNLARAATKDMLETTHLKMLKWVLGVHRRTNNNFCYGDTGRTPWAIEVLPQCIRYFLRVSSPSLTNSNPNDVNFLVYQAVCEQKDLDLSWYKCWHSLTTNYCDIPTITSAFKLDWTKDLSSQRKMNFYRSLKKEPSEEPYLSLHSHPARVSIARLRSSGHDLRIERGRYSEDPSKTSTRTCRFCCDTDTIECLEALPLAEPPVLETEEHCLTECPAYHPVRTLLSDNLKSLLMLKEYGLIMVSEHALEFGKYLSQCYRIRNPDQQK